MTTQSLPAAETVEAPKPDSRSRRRTYSVTRSGIWAVAQLDIKRRGRHGRSSFMLGVYLVVYTVLAGLAYVGAPTFAPRTGDRGAAMFGILVYMVMAITFTVVPIISAARINGDAQCGVLGELQRTQLTPAEIVVGKLVAGWVGVFFLMATALPAMAWAYLQGGTSIWRMLVVIAVLACSLMAACAIGLCWSAVVQNVSSAMLLTTLTISLGVVGLPILWAMTLPLTAQTDRVNVSSSVGRVGDEMSSCVSEEQLIRRVHGEKTWWLFATSPLVIVADASPLRPEARDPLSFVRLQMREVGVGPRPTINHCENVPDSEIQRRAYLREKLPPLWPLGVFADIVITALFIQLTIEQVRKSGTRPPVRGSFS